MIEIEMTQRLNGADVASAAGMTAMSRNGAQMRLARMLVGVGVPDRPWRTVRSGRIRMFGPSLHRSAGLMVTEGDHRPRIVAFVPHPRSVPEEIAALAAEC